MLHVPLRGRQVRSRVTALLLASALAALPCAPALAQDASAVVQAETLARAGQHGEAARLYEQSAKRGFLKIGRASCRERV
jgi:hypothetical protein